MVYLRSKQLKEKKILHKTPSPASAIFCNNGGFVYLSGKVSWLQRLNLCCGEAGVLGYFLKFHTALF